MFAPLPTPLQLTAFLRAFHSRIMCFTLVKCLPQMIIRVYKITLTRLPLLLFQPYDQMSFSHIKCRCMVTTAIENNRRQQLIGQDFETEF